MNKNSILIKYFNEGIEINKNLLENKTQKYERDKYKILTEMHNQLNKGKISKKSLKSKEANNQLNKSKINEENEKSKETNNQLIKDEKKNEIEKNLFSYIILNHNIIMNLTDELIHESDEEKKSKKRNEINIKWTEFYDYLKNLSNKDKAYIKKYNYLKILMTRVFYNYLELLFIDQKCNKNTSENFIDKYEKFKKFVDEFDINNNLVNKIHADYYFVINGKEKAERFYSDYIKKDPFVSPAGLFGHAVCLYINNIQDYNVNAINRLKQIIEKIKSKEYKFNNQIAIITKLEKLLKKLS